MAMINVTYRYSCQINYAIGFSAPACPRIGSLIHFNKRYREIPYQESRDLLNYQIDRYYYEK